MGGFRPGLSWKEFLGCEVFNRSHTVNEFSQIELCVSVQIHSSDDGKEKPIVGKNATFNQEPLEVDLINIFVVPVVNRLEQDLQAVIVPRCQLLPQQLKLSCKPELLGN